MMQHIPLKTHPVSLQGATLLLVLLLQVNRAALLRFQVFSYEESHSIFSWYCVLQLIILQSSGFVGVGQAHFQASILCYTCPDSSNRQLFLCSEKQTNK